MTQPQDREDAGGLEVTDARVTFAGNATPALDDVSLTLPRGRVLAVLGPSGCGKSTLLRAVAGLQALEAGRIAFDGTDVTRVPTHKRDFALMFQDGQLFGHLDVAGNVAYALARRGTPAADRDARVAELLDLVGLSGLESRRPATLSGGQQQRVALARALAARPRLLLLDEPLSALDRSLRERLAGDLRSVLLAEGATALFVTHDHDEALTVADDMAIMRDGRIVQHGSTREVWAHPVDEETADFLGFTTHLTPDEAQRLGLERAAWALRRGGLRVVGVDAPGALPGRVARVSASGEATHVSVTLDALPGRELEAIAYPSDDAPTAATLDEGARVGVRVSSSGAVRFG
ncbi:ABC transporter ATP-binding protein [Dermacoccus sp. PE3]|uniref:ABC transporter ATP-binding protein n=1 Tax=Dermacoccus sp. PE3 TaxID=1641401 RepID=UPI000699F184|nr:ABC transporter ATP-binding protein [Dermacoccus sp. PE3]